MLTIVVIVIGVPASFVWHALVVRHQVNHLLTLATKAEDGGDLRTAIPFLNKYLVFHPKDVDVIYRLARALEQVGQTASEKARAIEVYALALHHDPNRTDIHLAQAKLSLQLGLLKGARESVEAVLQTDPENADASRLLALVFDESRRESAVDFGEKDEIVRTINAFENALDHHPEDIELATRFANFYREHSVELEEIDTFRTAEQIRDRADRIMDEMVAVNQKNGRAFLARHLYRSQYDLLDHDALKSNPDLDDDLKQALKFLPDNVDVHLAAAQMLLNVQFMNDRLSLGSSLQHAKKAHVELSRKHLEKAVKLAPSESRVYIGLALAYWFEGKSSEVVAAVRLGIEHCDDALGMLDLSLLHFDVLLELERWEEIGAVLTDLDKWIAIAQAEESTSTYARDSLASIHAAIELAHARLHGSPTNPKRNLSKAVEHLRRAAQSARSGFISSTANYNLAVCSAELGQWDIAVAAFHQAAMVTGSLDAQLRAADGLERLGRVDEAVKEFRFALKKAQRTGRQATLRAAIGLAKAELRRQSEFPAEKREWDEFERALQVAAKADPNSPAPTLMKVRFALMHEAGDGNRAALQLLSDAEKAYSDSPLFWSAVATIYLQLHRVDDAHRAVAMHERLTGRPAPELRARIAMVEEDYQKTQAMLEQASDQLDGNERSEMLATQAEFALQTGDNDRARAILAELTALDPNNLRIQSLCAQSAVLTKDVKALEELETRLRRLESESGTLWRYCRAQRLLLQAVEGRSELLDEAEAMARTLQLLRPEWHLSSTTAGRVAEAQGKYDDAIAAYGQAVFGGDRRPTIVHRLAGLYMIRDRSHDAWTCVTTLPDTLWNTPQLLPLAVLLTAKLEGHEAALVRARAALAARPADPEFHVVAANVLLNAGENAMNRRNAENLLRRAVQLAPSDLNVHLALLHFYVSSPQIDAPWRILETLCAIEPLLHQGDEISSAFIAGAVARCFQLSGDLRAAEHYYRLQRQSAVQGESARFTPPPGTIVLDEISVSPASVRLSRLRYAPDPVRHVVGLLRAFGASSADHDDSEQLLRDSDRLKAISLVLRAGPANRHEALKLLQHMTGKKSTNGDRLLLARLSRHHAPSTVVFGYYRALAEQAPAPALLREYAETALSENAQEHLEFATHRLAKLVPAGDPVLTRFKIHELALSGQSAAAVAAARQFVKSASEDAGANDFRRTLTAARWMFEIGSADEFKKLVATARPATAGEMLMLAELLSRDPKRVGDVIGWCEKAAHASQNPRPAWLLTQLRMRMQLDAKQDRRAEALIDTATKAFPKSDDLISAVIVLREHEGRIDEAIRLCRRAHQLQPDSVVYLNNLAWLLGCYKGKLDEALGYLNDATSIAGSDLAMRDTLAVVLHLKGEHRRAMRLSEGCLIQAPDSASAHLHLADAYFAAGHHAASRSALMHAMHNDLARLTPYDRGLLERLEKSFAATNTP